MGFRDSKRRHVHIETNWLLGALIPVLSSL
jgi:hypothetical protein